MAFEYAVVLTGSIATGKSTVAEVFSSFGWSVIDADKIAHTILDKQYEAIASMFGEGYIVNSKVKREELGKLIFKDKKKKEELEALLHPLIYQEIEYLSLKEDRFKKPYLIDIPLFFETKRYPIEKSLVVYTTKDEQLKRLMQRNGYNMQEALSRIASQIDIEKKRQMATYVITNINDLEALTNECKSVKEQILGDFK